MTGMSGQVSSGTTESKGNVSDRLAERLEWQGKIIALKVLIGQREETRDYSMAYVQALDDLLKWNHEREAQEAAREKSALDAVKKGF